MTNRAASPDPALAVDCSRLVMARARSAMTDVELTWVQPGDCDNWTLPSDALALLMAVVAELQPAHVVEFGSGLSTRALARASAHLDPAAIITSIDHDPVFGALAAKRVADDGMSDSVCFVVAPLVARTVSGRGPALPMYHLDEARLGSALPADLVLIDGPPGMLGGREGSLYQALALSRPGTIVLLDDANRPAERQAMSRWSDELAAAIDITLLPGFERGLAQIIIADTGTEPRGRIRTEVPVDEP